MSQSTRTIEKIPVSLIQKGKYQPRKAINEDHIRALSDSIHTGGLDSPITVRKTHDGKYDLISGEHRWRAVMRLGWTEIDAFVRDVDARTTAISAINSNGGLPLNPIELAESFARLTAEFNMTHAQIASECCLGKNRTYVTHVLALLKLPQPVRLMIQNDELSFSHARILREAPDHLVTVLAEKAVTHSWDTRRLKREIDNSASPYQMPGTKKDMKTADWIELEEALSETAGMPVKISRKGKRGSKKGQRFEVHVTCNTEEEFERYVALLKDFKDREAETKL